MSRSAISRTFSSALRIGGHHRRFPTVTEMYEEKFSSKASALIVCTLQVIVEEGLVISARSFHSGNKLPSLLR